MTDPSTPPRDIDARFIGLVDLHNNACSLVGSVLDKGDVVLIGDSESAEPYAVLMSARTFVEDFGGELPSQGDEGDEVKADVPAPAPLGVPIKGLEGHWACVSADCPGITDEPGGKCVECGEKANG